MYTEFYGLREMPFSLTPDARFLYSSPSHKEALAQMLFGTMMRRGFLVLTGEVGTGKTTLIHAFLERLNSQVRTAFIFHTILTGKGLLKLICKDFGITTRKDTKIDLLMGLNEFLVHNFSVGENAVLIIDEAHNLKPHVLEEIRLLSNLETSRCKLLQIMLVGQPELGIKLDKPELRQFKQRVSLQFHLVPLSRQETEEYINHRLKIAGYQRAMNLFTQEAIDEIYYHTQGIPRLINILCDNALLMGYVTGSQSLDHQLIKKVEFEDTYREMEDVVSGRLHQQPSFPTAVNEKLGSDAAQERQVSPFQRTSKEEPSKGPSSVIGVPESKKTIHKIIIVLLIIVFLAVIGVLTVLRKFGIF